MMLDGDVSPPSPRQNRSYIGHLQPNCDNLGSKSSSIKIDVINEVSAEDCDYNFGAERINIREEDVASGKTSFNANILLPSSTL